MNEKTIMLIDECITHGKKLSLKIGESFNELDEVLGQSPRDSNVRNFFDCWCDAINHNFEVYDERNPNVWVESAIELRNWYESGVSLAPRAIWKEVQVGVFEG